MNTAIKTFIDNNKAIYCELANTYTKKSGYSLHQYIMAEQFITKHYTEDNAKLCKIIYKEITRRKNNSIIKELDHLGEMTMREFRHLIEKLTDNKVCVNGGKAYLHIYNWLFKDGKKTCYRTHNYYISVGCNCPRTIEQAQVIANKCLEFAKIENYGQNEEVSVEKF